MWMTLQAATVFVFLAVFAPGAAAAATDLRLTDSRGTEVVVANATIDYGGFLGSEKVSDGIRVLQGDGVVFLKWSDVESIKVVKRDESVKPARVELEVVLKNGKKVAAALFRQGAMTLQGKTDLGEYSIPLDKVRSLAPAR